MSDPNEIKETALAVVLKYLAGSMAVVYIVVGTAILLKLKTFKIVNDVLGPYNTLFGITLIAYGLFRGYQVYKRHFQKQL